MSVYTSVQSHRSMIFDDLRNAIYNDAIKKAVTKESVVLDLGTGLGLHGLMAASYGAKKVYLVEPSPVIKVAREIAELNGLSGRMDFLEGTIEEIQLPEQVDVIISVFTGNFLLEEDLLPSLLFARDRYLRPDGILLPERATMEVVPVSMADYYEKVIAGWDNPQSGFDYSHVRTFSANTVYYDRPSTWDAAFLAPSTPLMRLDLLTATDATCHERICVRATASDLCHGWLGWFDALVGEQWLSTSPTHPQTHWSQAFLPLEQPVQVVAGDSLNLEVHRPEFGEWTWITEVAGARQKQSTFLSAPLTLESMRRKSEKHQAVLAERGRAAQTVLRQLDGTVSTATIAAGLNSAYPRLFPDPAHALRFVIQLVEEYT